MINEKIHSQLMLIQTKLNSRHSQLQNIQAELEKVYCQQTQDKMQIFSQKISSLWKSQKSKINLFKNKAINCENTASLNHVQSYQQWIFENEPDQTELVKQRSTINTLNYQPVISIVTPVYNPPSKILQETIESLINQTYDNWEFCLVDGSSNIDVRKLLAKYADIDKRIKVKFLEKNLGISGNSNEAIKIATGEFIAFLDHDDTLAPFALFEVVKLLNQNQNCDLIYSDHDLLAGDSSYRFQPLFKPDWSPDIMLSANYLTHLTVIRKDIIEEIGGFDSCTDGAQDWDLFLKVIEKTQRVVHIPKVLYHWRDTVGSTATNSSAKPYVPAAQLRVIQKHLERQGLPNPKAFFDDTGFIRVAWQCKTNSKISIIIPTKGSNHLLERCVNSILLKTVYPHYEIIIVNNGPQKPSEFPYYEQISQNNCVKVLHYEEKKFNYSAVNNFGVNAATGDILLFLNNDTEVITSDWLNEMLIWTQRPEVGVVGAKLLTFDGTIQHAGVILGLTGFAGHIFGATPEDYCGIYGFVNWYRNFVAVTGACMMMRREVFNQVGGFNEEFILCGSDVELCLNIRSSGYRIVYNPFVKLKHVESATHKGSIPSEDFETSWQYYLPLLESGDPYYNPNLSYWHLEPKFRTKDEVAPLEFTTKFIKTLNGEQ